MVTDLIIPMLNEAENLPALFASLTPLIDQGVLRHIVVADNGSTDGSAELAADLGAILVHEPRRGYGGACLAAWNHLISIDPPSQLSTGESPGRPEAVAFLDADGSDDPNGLAMLIAALENHELAIGCRTRLADPGALNFVQRFGNRYAVMLISLATGHRYRDLGPMRAIRFEAMKSLDMRDRTWGWTVEMQMKAALLGWPIAQIDVPYRKRRAGKSKISGTLVGTIRAGTKITTTIGAMWWSRHAIRCAASVHHAAQ